jgi:hypothetical protein
MTVGKQGVGLQRRSALPSFWINFPNGHRTLPKSWKIIVMQHIIVIVFRKIRNEKLNGIQVV